MRPYVSKEYILILETLCLPLDEIVAGRYKCYNPKVEPMTSRVNGTTCQLVCDDGFGPQGQTWFFCDDSGKWNKTEGLPSCVRGKKK